MRPGATVQPGVVGEDRAGRGCGGQAEVRQHHAHPGAGGGPGPVGVDTDHGDGSSVRAAHPAHAVQQRGLARAVGTAQGHHLAGLHPQVDAVDRDDRTWPRRVHPAHTADQHRRGACTGVGRGPHRRRRRSDRVGGHGDDRTSRPVGHRSAITSYFGGANSDGTGGGAGPAACHRRPAPRSHGDLRTPPTHQRPQTARRPPTARQCPPPASVCSLQSSSTVPSPPPPWRHGSV